MKIRSFRASSNAPSSIKEKSFSVLQYLTWFTVVLHQNWLPEEILVTSSTSTGSTLEVSSVCPSNCVISAPKFAHTDFYLEGIARLVVERFSKKAELMAKMAEGKSSSSRKVRDARDYDKEAEEARYRSHEHW